MRLLVIEPKSCACKVRHSLRAVLDDKSEHVVEICPQCDRIHGLPEWLGKSVKFEPLGPDDHWITLKPHGQGSDDYVRVIVREHKDGTASIIRSPGGKLNYMHLTKLGSKEDWKDNAKKRQESKKVKAAAQTPEDKKALKEKMDAVGKSRDDAKNEFVTNALQTLGHDPAKYFTSDEDMQSFAPEMRDRLRREETNIASRKLNGLIGNMRDDMGKALEHIHVNDLGEAPLDVLIPPAPIGGERMGYNACVGERARAEGLTVDTLALEERDAQRRHIEERAAKNIEASGDEITPEAVATAANDMEQRANQLAEAMRGSRQKLAQAVDQGAIKTDLPPTATPDMSATMKLIQLRHEWKQKKKELGRLEREDSHPQDKGDMAYLEGEDAQVEDIHASINDAIKALKPEDAKRALEDELDLNAKQRTAGQFLSVWEDESSKRESLGGHYASGRFNILNTMWLNATGDQFPFDRAVVDTLGTEATCKLVAGTLRDQLSKEEFGAVLKGLENWHSNTQKPRAEASLKQHNSLMADYEGIAIPVATDADTLLAAQTTLDQKYKLLEQARHEIGTTHGGLEVSAQLIKQMGNGQGSRELRCPLGRKSIEAAIVHAHSLGLDQGDYQVDKRGDQTYLTINADGVAKLAVEIDPDRLRRMREVDDIKAGKLDQKGWLPVGIVSRPMTKFDDPQMAYRQINTPIVIKATDPNSMRTTLAHHIGERVANGEPIEAIRSHLNSADFKEGNVAPDAMQGYTDALDSFGFISATSDDALRLEDIKAMGDSLAADYLDSVGNKDAHLNTSGVDLGAAYETAHQIFAAQPEKTTWIFKPVVELTGTERRSMREAYEASPIDGTWDNFVSQHDSADAAYRVVQERSEGEFVDQFAKKYTEVSGDILALTKRQMDSRPQDMRVTIGPRTEAQLASIMPYMNQAFTGIGGKLNLPTGVNMSEGDFVYQQRMIRLFLSQKRFANSCGTGSGKSLMSIGAYTQGHADGNIGRAIFAVPSSVQSQFGAEMARFTEPGRYQWNARPGANREERHAAYSNKANNITVVTHEALRDDIIGAVAEHKFGGDIEAATNFMLKSPRKEIKEAVGRAIKAKSWNFDMAVVDEGHKLLNRKGKENSAMANALGGLTDGIEYYMPMSADPIKNDISEAHDFLSKIAPDQYSDVAKFRRKYDVNTAATQEGLKREMGLHQYVEKIPPPCETSRQTVTVPMTEKQKTAYLNLNDAFGKMSKAQGNGTVDIEAAKLVAPDRFAQTPVDDHEKLAHQIQENAGIYRNRAFDRITNTFDPKDNAKVYEIVRLVHAQKDGEGKQLPGLVFAREHASVNGLKQALKDAGLKVATYTGKNSGAERRRIQEDFQRGGKNSPDVIIASDAGSIGVQFERGAFAINANVPDTATTHEQRYARIERLGQMNPHIKLFDVITNTPYEHDRIETLNRKQGLRDIVTAPTESMDDSGLMHEIWQARKTNFEQDVAKAGLHK